MASMEKITSMAESKKDSLRKAFEHSIRFLTLHCNDLQDYVDSNLTSIQQRFEELESKEKHLESKEKQLDSARSLLEERSKEIESREKRLDSTQSLVEEQSRELDLKQESINERFGEIQSREKQLDSTQLLVEEQSRELDFKQESINARFGEIQLKEKELDFVRESIERRMRELESKEKDFEERCKEIASKEKKLHSVRKSIEGRKKELESKEKEFEERCKEIDSKEKEFEERCKEIESKEKRFHSIRELTEGRMRELESKEKEFEESCKEIESKEKKLQSVRKSIGERCLEVELREKEYEERAKLLELRERQCSNVVHSNVKAEQGQFSGDNEAKHSSAASLRFSITMDGRCLQIFLNEHVGDHESMRGDVYRALRMSLDSAKLVLDAIQGFFPPHLRKEFEASVVRKSCTLLLGQLMRVSPQIRPCVREEAKKLAVDWKGKMKVGGENSLEVLGFLQLVGAYRLLPDFGSDWVFQLFETIAQHREAPELCRALGFADKVPDFIQALIKRRLNLAAIRFIHAFDLVGEFPPVPILEDYLTFWKNIADETCKIENFTRVQIDLAKKSIAALRAVIKCIEDHKLEIEHSPQDLEKCINILIEKANSRCIAPANPKSQSLRRNDGTNPKSQLPPQSETSDGTPPMSSPKVQQQQQMGHKRPRTAEDMANPASSTYGGEGLPYLAEPRERYESARFPPPVDPHTRLYPDRSTPFLARDALRDPFRYNEPVSFHDPVDTYRGTGYTDRPIPYPRDALRDPSFYNGPVPVDRYNILPPYRPTNFP